MEPVRYDPNAKIPLAGMFDPHAVAIYGASEEEGSVGTQVLRRLRAAGFKGDIIPVNPKHQVVQGLRCLPDLGSAGVPVDLAVVATPSGSLPAVIDDLGRAGTRNAVVLSAGFGEGGKGEEISRSTLEAARRHQVRLLGPNCVGLVRPWNGLDATFLAATVPAGNLAFVTQSGALASAMADWAGPQRVGFSALVSMGNMLDLGFGEVLRFLEEDEKTRAVLLYVETIHDPQAFLSALRSICRHKPVIVLKGGRGAGGKAAAMTHTGALTGNDDVFDAALRRVGALRVRSLDALFVAAKVLASGLRSIGPRLAIITNGGGAGILAADRAGDFGIRLPELSSETYAGLDERLPALWSRHNPVDILGDAHPETFAVAVSACLVDPRIDAVLVMLTPQAMTRATDAAEAVIASYETVKPIAKPLLAAWLGNGSVAEARGRLVSAGIPTFDKPEQAVDAFAILEEHRATQSALHRVATTDAPPSEPDFQLARSLIDKVVDAGGGMMPEVDTKRLLAAFRIPVTSPVKVRSAAAAVAAARGMVKPLAMKVVAEGITHKTEVGGVQLGLSTNADVRRAFRDIEDALKRSNPKAAMSGVTLEPMVNLPHARELLVGASRDPVFGAVISFGIGGTMVELIGATRIELPPVDRFIAQQMIAGSRAAIYMAEWRGHPTVDIVLVENVLQAVSKMIETCPEIAEADLNPLIVGPDGGVVVDARIRIAVDWPEDDLAHRLAIIPCPAVPGDKIELGDLAITLRPLQGFDALSVQHFLTNLPPLDVQGRPFTDLDLEAADAVARLTRCDYAEEMIIGAFDVSGVLWGVARYVRTALRDRAEIGLAVLAGIQQTVVASHLLSMLEKAARAQGIGRLQGFTDSANAVMRRVLADGGYHPAVFVAEPDRIWFARDLSSS